MVWSHCCPRNSQEFSPTLQFKSISSLVVSLLYGPPPTTIHYYWKNHSFVGKIMPLLFNTLSRFVIAFLPRSKHLLISWLQFTIYSDFGAQADKVCHCFYCFPIYLTWNDGTRCHDFGFWTLSLKQAFSLSSFTFIKRHFSSSSLSAIIMVSSACLRLLIFLLAILIPAYTSTSLTFCMMYSA